MISVLSVLQTLQKKTPKKLNSLTSESALIPLPFFIPAKFPWLPERHMFQSGKRCLRCFNQSADSFKVGGWILGEFWVCQLEEMSQFCIN